MQKKQRIRYKLAEAKRKLAPGAAYNAGITAIGRTYDLSTAGGPLRGVAMFRQGAKYW